MRDPKNNSSYFSRILVTLMQKNFARVLRIVTLICTKSFKGIQRVLYMFGLQNENWKGTPPFYCKLRSVVRF